MVTKIQRTAIKQWSKITLLCFLSVTFWQCQKEDDLQEGRHFGPNLKRSKVNVLTGQKALEIKSLLDFEYNKGRKVAKNPGYSLRENNYTIDYSKIIEVIDTLGNTNYTFKIINHPDQEATNFFNLVLSVKTDGSTIKLVEYQMDEEFYTAYQNGEKDILDFEGTINFYTISTTDPCPPDDTPITTNPGTGGGGSGGGSSGPGSSGSGSSGGSSSGGGSGSVPVFEPPTFTITCNYVFANGHVCNKTYDSWEGYVNSQCGNGDYPAGFTITLLRTSNPSPTNPDPCPPADEEFGVIPDDPFFPEDPCLILQELMDPNKQNIVPEINYLKNLLINGTTIEHSSSFNTDTQQNDRRSGTVDEVDILFGPDYVGSVHLHPKSGYDIFSWADIRNLLNTKSSTSFANKPKVTLMLVTDNPNDPANPNVYALFIEDAQQLQTQLNNMWNSSRFTTNGVVASDTQKIKKIHDEMANLYEKNKNNLEAFFLQYTASFGVSLYKANNDVSGWAKLELNNLNGTQIAFPNPCN